MKLIKQISEMIDDEIEGAGEYAKMAMKYKDENPDLSRTFYVIATQEMEHIKLLHTAIVDIIEKYRKEKGDPPAAMMAVYDYLHDKHIEEVGEIKAVMSLYREG